MTHDAALKRVRLLILARNAIASALADAMKDLEEASAAEGRPMSASVLPEPPSAPAQRDTPTPKQSGLHSRFELPEEARKKPR